MEYSLRQQLEAFKKGEILDKSCFYFYDWFCKESNLERRALNIMSKVRQFVEVKNIDLDSHYVFLKNNCPFDGNLYDDFRIENENGVLLFTVTPSSGFNSNKGEAEMWGEENDFEGAILTASNWEELISKLQKQPTP